MTTLGLISDTHGNLSQRALDALRGVDEILHAGDVGGPDVIEELESVAPTLVVSGNMDWPGRWPAERVVQRTDRRILLLHDVGQLQRPSRDVLRRVLRDEIDIVVFGHSHRPADYVLEGIRFVNPGSAGVARSAPPSVARMTLTRGRIEVDLRVL